MEVDLRRLLGIAAESADRYGGDLTLTPPHRVHRLSVLAVSPWCQRFLPPAALAQSNTDRLLAYSLTNSQSYGITAHLSDKIGPRLSGSANAALAVRWTTGRFKEWGIPV